MLLAPRLACFYNRLKSFELWFRRLIALLFILILIIFYYGFDREFFEFNIRNLSSAYTKKSLIHEDKKGLNPFLVLLPTEICIYEPPAMQFYN